MAMFNDLLVAKGINPDEVAVLRHTGRRGKLGVTLYHLWKAKDGSFDRYQQTQLAGKPLFEKSPIWASFVANPDGETLFVGLYSAKKGAHSNIDWACPLDGVVTKDRRRQQGRDYYELEPRDELSEIIDELKIYWGRGLVGWGRYAAQNNFPILAPDNLDAISEFAGSAEGKEQWRLQKAWERNEKLKRKALLANRRSNSDKLKCEGCNFLNEDRALFDVHHKRPLMAGPRRTRLSELAVLCPVCHRKAHRSDDRLTPHSIEYLQEWNLSGRP